MTQAFLEAIEAATRSQCLRAADAGAWRWRRPRTATTRLAKGDARPLEGLPLGIKDLYCTKGVRTTACSNILDDFTPTYESTVTQNCGTPAPSCWASSTAMSSPWARRTRRAASGRWSIPWRRKGSNVALVPGGSSGGSSSAVAADLCLGATATDTGGSIRQPAAITGTVGIKPTYGRCSRWGIVAFASSLDQAGPIAKTVRDAAIMLRAHGERGSRRIRPPSKCPCPTTRRRSARASRACRVGVPKEYRIDGMPKEIEELWQQGIDWLKAAGATIQDISPAAHQIRAAGLLHRGAGRVLVQSRALRRRALRPARAGHDLIDTYETTRAAGFGAEVRRRMLIGTYVLSAGYYDAYYLKAQKVRTLIKRDFDEAVLKKVDVLLTPTTPGPAFGIGEVTRRSDAMYLERHLHRDGEHGGTAGHLGAGRTFVAKARRWVCS